MRKTTKQKSQLTLSAEKLRDLQSTRAVLADELVDVAGGRLFCQGSSFGCINSACTC
ncbi:MAG TPA: hypothetical protein VIU61_29520 [Kofleriaceae bacterium]